MKKVKAISLLLILALAGMLFFGCTPSDKRTHFVSFKYKEIDLDYSLSLYNPTLDQTISYIGIFENNVCFHDNYRDEHFYFEDNDFEKERISIPDDEAGKILALQENLEERIIASGRNEISRKMGNTYYTVKSTYHVPDQSLGRTEDWRKMQPSKVYRYTDETYEEQELIFETHAQMYVLYFDDEKIITFTDNKIIKTYYESGEHETIMTVDWDDGKQDKKIQYEIRIGQNGFSCNEIIYAAAYDKIFRFAGMTSAV